MQLELIQMYIDNQVRWCLKIKEGYKRAVVLPMKVHAQCKSMSAADYDDAEIQYGELTPDVARRFLSITHPTAKVAEQLRLIAQEAA